MEPLIEVADKALPVEASVLLNPALPLPKNVDYYNDRARPGNAAVAWYLGGLFCLSIAVVFGADLPQAFEAEDVMEKIAGVAFTALFFWGFLACVRRGRNYTEKAIHRKTLGPRHGLFIAPDFILWGQQGKWTCLPYSHAQAVRLRTLPPHSADNSTAASLEIPEVEYLKSTDHVAGWLSMRTLGTGLSASQIQSRITRWLALERGGAGTNLHPVEDEPEPQQQPLDQDVATDTSHGNRSWIDRVESTLPPAAQSLLDASIPIPDDVRFYVLRPTPLVKDAVFYGLATLGTASFLLFCSVKILLIIVAQPSLGHAILALVSAACLFLLSQLVTRLLYPELQQNLKLLQTHRTGGWRRGLFLGPEHLLLCIPYVEKDIRGYHDRLSCTWLRRQDLMGVRRRCFSYGLGGLKVDQLGCLDSDPDSRNVRWFGRSFRLSEVAPGPDMLRLWTEWAKLEGELLPGKKRGEWDWKSASPPAR